MRNWPRLTAAQRRQRDWCVAWVALGVSCILIGSVQVVDPSTTVHLVVGIVSVLLGVVLLGAGIFAWPTRWRNRLREIRDEWGGTR